jgi:hypothetical protein
MRQTFFGIPEPPALLYLRAGDSKETRFKVVMMLWWLMAFMNRLEQRVALFSKPFDALPGIESAWNAHFLVVSQWLRWAFAQQPPAPTSRLARSPAPALARI